MKRDDRSGPARRRWRALGLVVVAWWEALVGVASGQVALDDYARPILSRNGQSHYATIKDLAFRGDRELLSSGFDKVVHAWDLANPSGRPIRTLRPPIFKGELGQIWTIALSPVEVEGQGLLAVAGYSPGVDNESIVLMRYPGRVPVDAGGTGEILGYLQKPRGAEVRVEQSSGRIVRLAFGRDGRTLVSAGQLGSLTLWDVGEVGKALVGIEAVSNLRPLRTIPPPPGPSALASMVLAGDVAADRWILAGLSDGRIFRHDLSLPGGSRELTYARLASPELEGITGLGGAPGLPWVVAGTNKGQVLIVDVEGRVPAFPIRAVPGKILAVDVARDGRKIAVSVRSRGVSVESPPPIDRCGLLLYESDDGRTWKTPRTLRLGGYPIEVVRFGPGHLAFAGDNDQAVTVLNLSGVGSGWRVSGPGSAIWDVGFVDQPGRAIAYSRDPADYRKPRRTGAFPGFDLSRRGPSSARADQVFRPDPAASNVAVAPAGPFTFVASLPGVAPRRIELQPRDGRWSSYLFLPPLVVGGAPLLAVGTDSSVSIFNLADGQRTRYLQGHESTVTALGVSRDGRWLISGSADQSLRLWATPGFDRVLGFGARASMVAGRLVVDSVVDGGYAMLRGLRPGDVIETARIDASRVVEPRFEVVPLDQFLARADALEAGQTIELKGRHATNSALNLISRKFDAPTLSLFLDGKDPREWVLWTPRGYYSTSIQGDARFLGWHRNVMRVGLEASTLFADTERTIFAPISVFRQELQKNEIIDGLIAGNPPVAGRPADPPSPAIALVTAPGLRQVAGDVEILVPVERADEGEPRVVATLDGKRIPPEEIRWTRRPAGYLGKFADSTVRSFGDRARLWAQRVETFGRSSPTSLDLASPKPPPASPKGGRLFYFGYAKAGRAGPGSGGLNVVMARQDVTDVWKSFGKNGRLLAPKGGPLASRPEPFAPLRGGEVKRTLDGEPTTYPPSAVELIERLDDLEGGRFEWPGRPSTVGDGDVVLIHIEADSVFGAKEGGQILLEGGPAGESSALATDALRDRLASLAGTGCRVYLFLDIVHDRGPMVAKDARDSWIRGLLDSGVSCFLASKDRPSWPRPDGPAQGSRRRLFARSLIEVADRRSTPLTFDAFAAQAVEKAKGIVTAEEFDPDFLQHWNPEKLDPRDLFLAP